VGALYRVPHTGPPPATGYPAWAALWLLATLALGGAALGQGWALQFTPARALVLLGVPIALLVAWQLDAWCTHARRALLTGYAVLGALGIAAATLFFQGPLGHDPARPGAFAYLRYDVMTAEDARLLDALPPGAVVLAPAWRPIAFGEIAAQRPGIHVIGGPGAMNLSGTPWRDAQVAVARFFRAATLPEQRPDIARHLGATHVWVPHGATGTARLRAQLEATPGFAMVARAGSGVVYAFTPPPQTPGALAVGTAQVVAQQ